MPDIGEFETIVLNMEVSMVKDSHYAHNIISITSNLYWGYRPKYENPCFSSKIRSMTKWPLCSLKCQHAITIWYLNENELIYDFRGRNGLKQPRICKFEFGWAWAKSTRLHINTSVDFIRCSIFQNCTSSESSQNSHSISLLPVSVTLLLKF